MTNGQISSRVVAERIHWIQSMLAQIRSLPLDRQDQFFADHRNHLACESCLRRALEALLDLGRHILAKGFGIPVEEYKAIGPALEKEGVVSKEDAALFKVLAGYRNRMVHFYHEISEQEIYEICAEQLGDVERLVDVMRVWLKKNMDTTP